MDHNLSPYSEPQIHGLSDINTARNNDNATEHNITGSGPSSTNIGHIGGTQAAHATGTTTTTMVFTEEDMTTLEAPILRLTLRPHPHVTWDEGVINNEGLGRKSSKRCCIFHKQRAFGESSTESSENDSGDDGGSTSSSSSGGGGSGKAMRPMAKKKKGGKVGKPKVPDYQRYHA